MSRIAGAAAAPGVDSGAAEFFEAKVRPVLAEHCYSCHSAGLSTTQGGVRLDKAEAFRQGDEGIVTGEPDKTRLIRTIHRHNSDPKIPATGRLSPQQIKDLTEWVRRGAVWPHPAGAATASSPAASKAFDLWQRRAAHWAWQPVRAQSAPAVKNSNWVKDPVDAFVLSKLEAKGLAPAPPAERRSLVRRLSFALTGLPPTPEEVEAFVNDASSDATEKVVDRLIASPHFGERWARHWMDLVRYSDTLGNEADMPIPNAWRYRDYLVRAFNADVPYDQLVKEHVAGDLLPKPRLNPADHFNESVIGTGFFCMSEGKRSPVDLRLAQAEAFDNRLDVMSKTFLGLTVACARCHDHKFDAIPSSDYYALYGYLKSSRYTQAMLNKADLDAKAAELTELRARLRSAAGTALAARAAALAPESWLVTTDEAKDAAHPLYAWKRVAELGPGATSAAVATRWAEVVAELKARAASDEASRRRNDDVELAHFETGDFGGWSAEDQAFGKAPLRPGDFLPGTDTNRSGTDTNRPVATFVRSGGWAHSAHLSRKLQGTLRSPEFPIDRRFLHLYAAGRASRITVVIDQFVMIQDPLYGSLRRVLDSDGPKWITFDLSMWKGQHAYVEVADTTTPDLHDMKPPAGCGPEGWAALGRAVLSDQGPPAISPPVAGLALLGGGQVDSVAALKEQYGEAAKQSLAAFAKGTLSDKPDAESRAALLAFLVERGVLDLPKREDPAELGSLLKQWSNAEAKLPEVIRAPAMTEGTPQDEYVFLRGNPKTAGPLAPRRMLQAIAGAASEQPPAPKDCSGRLQLARLIAGADNPLTARVMVNRVWHHLFGRGIVSSTDNFGALGDAPTHPELLDYLADRFVKEGWSIKKLVRALALSNTYAMSSQASPEAEAADPDNRLLHRMPIRRLEAEAVRDAILAVSGRLDRTLYGKPVEVHMTPFMDNNYGDDYGRPKSSGPLDGAGRRSLYVMIRRNFLTPMLVAFDMPPPLSTAGRRSVSNVPAQALILMNDPFVAEQAKVWAKRVLALKDLDATGRVRRMYLEAFARPPTDREVQTALRFLDHDGEVLGVPTAARAEEERMWADLAQVLINVKEFTYLN